MYDTNALPKQVFSGAFSSGSHVQGIAMDENAGYLYYSFTTFLLKTDLQGNPIGSVNGLLGHLGCIAYSAADGCVYGSLEYKNDSIGRGILRNLHAEEQLPDAFYVACFDVSRIDRMGMDAERDGVLRVVRLEDVCSDYAARENGILHRHGCSGIDGITCCSYPFGEPSLFVAYGIYSDVSRDDNDDQVILQLPLEEVRQSLHPLCQRRIAEVASLSARRKLFVRTGNTTYGIQNLEYDPSADRMIAAVYCGEKPQYPNPPMFFFDLKAPCRTEGRCLYYGPEAVSSSDFPLGSTGIIALGNDRYYFSEDGRGADGYYTNVRLYAAAPDNGFRPVE